MLKINNGDPFASAIKAIIIQGIQCSSTAIYLEKR